MKLQNFIPSLSTDKANFIEHDEAYWELLPFFEDKPYKQVGGGNGQIFRIINPLDGEECIIKVSKFSEQSAKINNKNKKRLLRFYREIEALNISMENGIEGVVRIYGDGKVQIEGKSFPYFIMEKCDCNLREYLTINEINISQRILLCYEIAKTIDILHKYEIYHRDIKAENIFFMGNKPIVGDLGLVENRDSDFIINEKGDIIGPIGWMTPEATNKFLTERTKFESNFNCKINNRSDVFQLGKLFWYILQGNLPIGQLIFDDFIERDKYLFDLIFNMLQYDSKRRPQLNTIQEQIKKTFPNYHL
jgi:serine/threonine protein kinase